MKQKSINLNIKNYKSILSTDYTINLNKINYVLGGNESGKTNILESICYLDIESKFDRLLKGSKY